MRFSLFRGTIVLGFAVTTLAQAPRGIQDVLSSWQKSPYANYPTQFTRDIIPKKIHSHNDYWRKTPLYTAISNGAISVEADVWLYNGTLYVGHDTSSLTANRTFQTLYIDPLVEILTLQNPTSLFVLEKTRNGVYDASVGQPLFLFVDIKTNGVEAWPYVLDALAPLRERDWLTTVNGSTITPGPVTVIGTGASPLELIAPVNVRDYFFDGSLEDIETKNITRAISPIASTSFLSAIGEIHGTGLSATQKQTLKSHIKVAHDRGIQVRYWELPSWPISTRNAVWRELVESGVDLLNVDDLEAAANLEGV